MTTENYNSSPLTGSALDLAESPRAKIKRADPGKTLGHLYKTEENEEMKNENGKKRITNSAGHRD
jgi:hypothetical protein